MFVRRKHNKSGTTSIQVVAKIDGKYRVQKSFGCSREESVLSSLERKAVQWAEEKEYGGSLFEHEDAATYDAIFASIGQSLLRLVGPDLIYGRLFDKIGFNRIKTADDEMFKASFNLHKALEVTSTSCLGTTESRELMEFSAFSFANWESEEFRFSVFARILTSMLFT